MKRRDLLRFPPAALATMLFVVTGLGVSFRVGEVLNGPQTTAREKLILRMYDLNCRAGIPAYRYPRSVMWFAEGDLFHGGSWETVLTCGSH